MRRSDRMFGLLLLLLASGTAAAVEPRSSSSRKFGPSSSRLLLLPLRRRQEEQGRPLARYESRFAQGGRVGARPGARQAGRESAHQGGALRPRTARCRRRGSWPEAIADLEKWVAMGAPDPRVATGPVVQQDHRHGEGRQFWAYQKPKRIAAADRSRTPAGPAATSTDSSSPGWKRRGCGRPADADRATLIRRALFRPHRPAADARADRRLRQRHVAGRVMPRWSTSCWRRRSSASAGAGTGSTSPATAESSGGGRSLHASRTPGATAITSSTPSTPTSLTTASSRSRSPATCCRPPAAEQRRQQLIATAFLLLGPTNYEEQDKETLEMDVIDEQLDTHGQGVPRHDDRLCPLPRSQVRPDPDQGLLRPGRHLQEHADADSRQRVAMGGAPLPVAGEQQAALEKHEAAVAALKTAHRRGQGRREAHRHRAELGRRRRRTACPASSSTTRRPSRSASGSSPPP